MLYALGYQACVNGLPLVLEWRAGGRLPALTGAFVVANSYFRAALIIAGGLLVQALTTLSVTWGMGDRLAFSAALRRATFRSVCLALGSSAVALVAAPYVLPLLYGGPLGLPVQASVALASSTVLVVVAAVQTIGLLAMGQGWRAVAAWSSGAVAMLAVALILPVDDGIFFWAPVAAPAAALALASWSLRAGHRAAPSATDVP
jgi:hypothetical protein